MAIKKSEGFTPTERLLANFCENTFLKLWSYPNPYKDDHDELCDVLAVFENHVFIFFDRMNQSFENKGDVLLSWSRWKKKSIDNQIRTAHGAERYLLSGRAIFLEKDLQTPFPITIDREHMIVHKIIVAHGVKDACKEYAPENIYGSLAIEYADHVSDFGIPFLIHIDRNRPVHVFDTENLPIIFKELDTFFDFTAYLHAKYDAIRSSQIIYCGEEDLLANYFLNFDDSTNRHYIGTKDKKVDFLWIAEGEWQAFIKRDEYKQKKKADSASYFWDEIIQKTCNFTLNDELIGNHSPLQGKSAIHEMAKEPRFHRRSLSEHMIKAIREFPTTSAHMIRHVSLMPSFFKNKRYVFLQLKSLEKMGYDREYRPMRQAMLEIACGAAKNRYPEIEMIIGIAIDAPKYSRMNSEDFLLMDCSAWTDDLKRKYEKSNESMGFFETENLKMVEKRSIEFPSSIKPRSLKKVGRNDPCPCGSGKKYKYCCLK